MRELIPACDEWTAKGEITSEDDARLCTEFLEQLRCCAALVEQRAADLKPFEERVLIITTLYKDPLAKLDLASNGSRAARRSRACWRPTSPRSASASLMKPRPGAGKPSRPSASPRR